MIKGAIKVDTESKVLQIPIEDIIPNRFQPRLAFDDSALNELAESIKVHGIIQPLVLRRIGDKYEIIAGERRYKAATIAGLVAVPAIISNLDDKESAEVAVVENVQRKDLTAIEEAKSYKALLDKGYMSQDDLARRMGLSQSAISNKLRLLSLDPEVQDAVLNEKISERHARSLLKVKSLDDQRKLLNEIIEKRLTVKQLEDEIKKLNGDDLPPVNDKIDLQDIKENATDIINNKEEKDMDIFNMPKVEDSRFFNFNEDEPVNMTLQEPETNIFEEEKPIEEIEMLDIEEANDDTNEIISKIKELVQNKPNITISELSLGDSYNINIKIKKDNLN